MMRLACCFKFSIPVQCFFGENSLAKSERYQLLSTIQTWILKTWENLTKTTDCPFDNLTLLKLPFAQSAILLCPIMQYINETRSNFSDKLQQKGRNQLERKIKGMASALHAISLSIQKNGENAVFA